MIGGTGAFVHPTPVSVDALARQLDDKVTERLDAKYGRDGTVHEQRARRAGNQDVMGQANERTPEAVSDEHAERAASACMLEDHARQVRVATECEG